MLKNSEILLEENPDARILVASKLFWLGFIIYASSYTINTTQQVNYTVCIWLQIIGLILLIPSAAVLLRYNIDNKYLKISFLLYCCWLIGVVIRGIKFDYGSVNQMLFDPHLGLFMYLAPLIILFPRSPLYYKNVFDVIVILCIVNVAYDLIFLKQLLSPSADRQSQSMISVFSLHLSLAGGYLFLTYLYHSKKRNILILITLIFTLTIAIIQGRRGLVVILFSILIFSYFIYLYANRARLIIIINSLIIFTAILFLTVNFYNERKNDAFSYITGRIAEDTRTGVELYFYEDMQSRDWIIGKGINGTYYCPNIEEGASSIYRSVIETGYLQIILKGGVISLGLLLLIAIPAIIKGLFYSNNILSKASGIWIFLFLLYLYPGLQPSFSLHYLLVWISIGICYSREIRNMPDEEIGELLLSQ